MAAYVGLDPLRDIKWVTSPDIKPMSLFAQGKIDAFLGFPPEPQELAARQVILSKLFERLESPPTGQRTLPKKFVDSC